MNRKQLFTNPAETNAHGSIRTAKWAKGAVAVVALAGALGVSSMTAVSASADEVSTEVVAPAATDGTASTPTEAVTAEQPVDDNAVAERPTVEATSPAETSNSVAEVESSIDVTEDVVAPAETAVEEQPIEANLRTLETPDTSISKTTSVSKEISRSDYEVTANVDVSGELTPNGDNSFVTHTSKIDFKVSDPSGIKNGDTLTFYTDAFEFDIANGTSIKLSDGTVIGTYTREMYKQNARDAQSSHDIDIPADSNEYTRYQKHTITFNNVFEDSSKIWGEVNFGLQYRGWQAAGFADHDRTVIAAFKDVNNDIIDSITFVAKDDTSKDSFGKLTNDTISKMINSLAKFGSNETTYNMNTNVISGIPFGYHGDTRTSEKETFGAGTQITYTLNDEFKKYLSADLTKSAWGSRTDKKGEVLRVGDIVTLDSDNIIVLEGSPVNSNGYFTSNSEPMRLKVVELTSDKVVIELVDGLTTQGLEFIGFFFTPISLKEISDTTINPTTGEIKDEDFSKTALTVTVKSGDGAVNATSDVAVRIRNIGTWVSGSGNFESKYVSTLNAVLEDGTVIKENMDATGLLKVGEKFTLTADKKITYNGIVYIPKDDKITVSGTTIDKPQTLTKVYIYSPQDNHAFVDLTVNHIDKETGAVMKTATTGNHEETTTYTTNAETFPDYNLEATPENATGTFGKDAVVVNYYYVHKKGNVVAKFVREDGTEIAPAVNVVTNVNTGADYKATHPAEIDYGGTTYRWVSTDGFETGKVTEGITTITNRYVVVKGTLIEKYVDTSGAEIKAQNNTLTDAPVKTSYTLEHPNEIQANGTTYRWVSTNGETTGQLKEGTTVVTYVYDTVKGDVIVKIVDAKTGNDIFPAKTVVDDKPITKTDYDVTSYNKPRITGKDGKTWDFVSVDGNQKGKVVEGVTTITFKYNEVKTAVTTKLISTDGKELRKPSTDADLSTGVSYNTIAKAPEVIYATDSNVYKRITVPANSQGVTTVEPITVTYVYKLQIAEPTKTIASTDGRDLTGKVLLAGDNVVYKFSTDLAKFKGISGLSNEDKHHAVIVVEDIADDFLTANMSQASVSSGKAFLNYYSSIDEAPVSIKSELEKAKVKTEGGFVVLTSFNPLATADEIKAQNLEFFNEFTNKGLDVSVILPTTVKATVDNAEITNKVVQIDFDGVTESPVVINKTPDINPIKDIVLNVGDEDSLQGQGIKVGTIFNYELIGTVYPANRGNKLTSYQQVDNHSDKVLPTGVYLVKSTAEIQFEDGYKLGDDLVIPAGTIVNGSWVTPVDIVSDKDGSVIKAGSKVVPVTPNADGSINDTEVQYVIEKDLVIKSGTDMTGIVLPVGTDFTKLFRQYVDADKHTVTYSMRQDAFEKISADSAFGFTTYMQVEQIKAGTTENTYTEIVNGVETKSNTVVHEGVEPEVVKENTPTTGVVNTPEIPVNTAVSKAGVGELPTTGEADSSLAILAGTSILMAAFNLAGRRRKGTGGE